MSTKDEVVILPEDDAAASIQTVTGWVSRTGRFVGDDERELEKFMAMPRAPWNGVGMLYCQVNEKFFADADDLHGHIYDIDADPAGVLAGMRLVICEPEFASEIDPYDHFSGSLPEDGDPPSEIIAAFEVLNKAIRECKEPLCWWPGETAAIVTLEQLGFNVAKGYEA